MIEQKASMIKKYEETKNYPAYTIEVHALKSASKQIGAMDLSEKAAELERAGNEGNTVFIHENTDALLSDYRSYIDVLAPYFAVNKQDNQGSLMLTAEILTTLFEKLRNAMDDLDMDAMEAAMEEMKQYRYEGNVLELFKQLQEAVENIDIDRAEEILRGWERLEF